MADLRSHIYQNVDLFDKRKRLLNIIVYSPKGIAYAREIYFLFKLDKCKEIYMLENEFDIFYQNYPFLTVNQMTKPYSPRFGYPSEIIHFKLYLGNYHHAEDCQIIENLKITHILNATNCIEMRFRCIGVEYLRLGVEDLVTENISAVFNHAYDFISEALSKEGNRVLVHCAQGMSRSVTLVIMYLMKSRKIGYEEAFIIVKTYRESASPNVGFIDQLRNLENEIFG